MSVQYVDLTPGAPVTADSLSSTRHRLFPVKVICPECGVNECLDCCPNDLGGAHLVAAGENIYLQYYFEDLYNSNPENPTTGWKITGGGDWWMRLDVYDENGVQLNDPAEGIEDFASAWGVSYLHDQSVQNVVIPSDWMIAAGAKCFYFCVTILSPSYDEFKTVVDILGGLPSGTEDYEEGDQIMAGNSLYEVVGGFWKFIGDCESGDLIFDSGTGQWWTSNGATLTKIDRPEVVDNPIGSSIQCCTNLYKVIRCEDSVLICTDRGEGRDCLGRIHDRLIVGVIQGNPQYKTCRRYPGAIEPIAYPIDREISEDGIVISGSYSEKARLRTNGICRYDAEEIAAILSAESFTINGEAWDSASNIEKNNDRGSHWHLDITLDREICEGSKECDFEFK